MSGHSRLDEAARLEAALARIARASARRLALQGASTHGTSPSTFDKTPDKTGNRTGDTAEIAARLDGLIAELRILLGPQDF
jgi:hypothetical protein